MGSFDMLKGLFIVLLALDLILFFSQVAISELNPTNENIFYNYENSYLRTVDSDNFTLNLNDTSALFPEEDSSISEEGNVFSDAYRSLKNWFLDTSIGQGFTMFFRFLGGVTFILQDAGAPRIFVFGIGAFWYLLTLFGFLSWIFGRG